MRVQVPAPKEEGERRRGGLPVSALQQGEEEQRIGRELAVGVVMLALVLLEVTALRQRDEGELVLAYAARELVQVQPERRREAAARRIVMVEAV